MFRAGIGGIDENCCECEGDKMEQNGLVVKSDGRQLTTEEFHTFSEVPPSVEWAQVPS